MSAEALNVRDNNYEAYKEWVDRVVNGPFTINGDQRKHFKGKSEYDSSRKSRNKDPSEIILSDNELYRLVIRNAGYGIPMLSRKGYWIKKELCTSDAIVGIVERNGNRSKTKSFVIHYANDGCHVVPRFEEVNNK